MKKLIGVGWLMIILLWTACAEEEKPLLETHALVRNLGNTAQGGCGWAIQIGNQFYKADQLPDQFLVDDLPVSIQYNLQDGLYQCGNTSPESGSWTKVEVKGIRGLERE